MELVEVVVTAEDGAWLAGFTRGLVGDRLAACGHLIPAMRAVYRWDGAVHDEPQARVGLHTRATLVPAIVERARSEHPDDQKDPAAPTPRRLGAGPCSRAVMPAP